MDCFIGSVFSGVIFSSNMLSEIVFSGSIVFGYSGCVAAMNKDCAFESRQEEEESTCREEGLKSQSLWKFVPANHHTDAMC
jgi:hypothetical protein